MRRPWSPVNPPALALSNSVKQTARIPHLVANALPAPHRL
jgi:hypothetical protein